MIDISADLRQAPKSMTYAQLHAVLDATELSPEQLAPAFSVGSMTIRRWKKAPGKKQVPKGDRWGIVETIYQLVNEGKLTIDNPAVTDLLRGSTSTSFQAIIKGMGVSDAIFSSKDNHQDKMTMILNQIGMSESHKREVDESSEKLSYFKKMGSEWKRRITFLVDCIRSPKLTMMDKLVAYGALFYLIMPFDLIPDHIPVIGLIDDFGVLGFAVAYYVKRFPELMKKVEP